jgi:hypothetical protein
MDRHSSIGSRPVGFVRCVRLNIIRSDYLSIVRTSTNDDLFASNVELANYVQECFWPRLVSSTIRLAYGLRDTNPTHKQTGRQWILEVKLCCCFVFFYQCVQREILRKFTVSIN